jgi:hypothetical protein
MGSHVFRPVFLPYTQAYARSFVHLIFLFQGGQFRLSAISPRRLPSTLLQRHTARIMHPSNRGQARSGCGLTAAIRAAAAASRAEWQRPATPTLANLTKRRTVTPTLALTPPPGCGCVRGSSVKPAAKRGLAANDPTRRGTPIKENCSCCRKRIILAALLYFYHHIFLITVNYLDTRACAYGYG